MPAQVRFVKPVDNHLLYVAINMREVDVQEVNKSSGLKPYHALCESVRRSKYSTVVLIDDEPVAVFGIVELSLLGSLGVPWMLATPSISKDIKLFMMETKKALSVIFGMYEQLYNYVDIENRNAIRWLKWIGFDIQDPKPYGIKGHLFCKFTKGYS